MGVAAQGALEDVIDDALPLLAPELVARETSPLILREMIGLVAGP